MLPIPHTHSTLPGKMLLSSESRIVSPTPTLTPLAQQLTREFAVFMHQPPTVADRAAQPGDVVLTLDDSLPPDTYTLDISDMARVAGGSATAVAHGTVTLLQNLQGGIKEPAAFPCLKLKDSPTLGYRGLMVDLARQWHSFDSLKKLVALCRWYKLSTLHLHLTDNESFTFPSTAYPALTTPDRHYSREQLQELEDYARTSGVTLLPELDVPGHSIAMLKALPELIACECEPPVTTCDICPGRESTYTVIKTLIGEMCDVFRTSPYFHIGADETERKAWKTCRHCQARMKQEGLANEEELYRYFIIRVNEMVRQQGRQTVVWEGFGPGGQRRVPTNITVMVFESDYHLAPDLLAAGYPVINTSWQPLYVCGPGLCWPPTSIYHWNPHRWETPWKRSPAYLEPIQIEPHPAMQGAQLCSWGQHEAEELPSLRERVAAMSERVWTEGNGTDLGDFFERMEVSDQQFSRFLFTATPPESWPYWIRTSVEKTIT